MRNLILGFMMMLATSYSATYCYPDGKCTSGFQNFQHVSQKSQNWCWAAVAEMILVNQGVPFRQEDALLRVYGGLVDRPANGPQLYNLLNGWAYNGNGVVTFRAEFINVNDHQRLIELMNAGKPVMVGLYNPGQMIGHAYALTAIYWNNTLMGPIPAAAVLRDPYPTNVPRQEWDWNSFVSRLSFALAIYVDGPNAQVPQDSYNPGTANPFVPQVIPQQFVDPQQFMVPQQFVNPQQFVDPQQFMVPQQFIDPNIMAPIFNPFFY